LHFFHGSADPVIPADHARQALERLAELDGDATLDIAEGLGHGIDASLAESALLRLTRHVPKRMWREAMGASSLPPDNT
jgi:phospholipase/carboxylesterase